MKRILNLLGIIANIAIVSGLVKDTADKIGSMRRKNTVTNSENDEVWKNWRAGDNCPWRAYFYTEGN